MLKRYGFLSAYAGLWLFLFHCPVASAQSPSAGKIEEVRQTQQVAQSQEVPARVDDTQLFMRAKLASNQKVMEGLVTENFILIGEGAKRMKRISENAHWPTTVDEVYQHHSVAFRQQCDKLINQAEQKDLQAAHYTYLHLSTTCIDCHNYVRGRFKVERKKSGGPVQLIPTHWDGPVKKQPDTPPQPDDWKSEIDKASNPNN